VKVLSGLDYGRSWVVSGDHARCGDRLREALESAGVGLLLLCVVVSAIAGAQTAYFITILAAWLLFPMLVGFRNTLDAGCAFMLISLGVAMVVGIAESGPGYLLP
jgi:predicted phage tail protein